MIKNSNTYFYTFDGLGSVTDLTDNSETVQEQYSYDSFGKIGTAPTTGNPYTYTSREYDGESGLYFYRARTYDPALGRFLQADPIRFRGGINWYTYVENNPINWIDPLGTDKCLDNARSCINTAVNRFEQRKKEISQEFNLCRAGVMAGCFAFCTTLGGTNAIVAVCVAACVGGGLAGCEYDRAYDTIFESQLLNTKLDLCKDNYDQCRKRQPCRR